MFISEIIERQMPMNLLTKMFIVIGADEKNCHKLIWLHHIYAR